MKSVAHTFSPRMRMHSFLGTHHLFPVARAAPLRRLGMATCRAYLGQNNPLAAEYHSSDFDWQEHARATAHLVEQQWAAAPAAVRQAAQLSPAGVPLSAVAQLLASLQQPGSGVGSGAHAAAAVAPPAGSTQAQQQQQHCIDINGDSASPEPASSSSSDSLQAHQQPSSSSTGVTSSSSSSSSDAAGNSSAAACTADNEWECFYRAHPSAKFFKERRYLLLEFPCLNPSQACVDHVVEIGAGCGSSILPVLRAQPAARATVCDVSSTCLQQLMAAVSLLGLSPERCSCFVADGTDPELASRLQGCAADVALIMFTLSAVQPAGMLAMMRNAAAALRPGGVLCIRDHALYDMVQLRIPGEQAIGRNLYKRGDGTLAYFFTVEDLLQLAAGLDVVECEYVCVINRNRKSGLELRRTFVHGVFRRPM